jgi:hypothetical protein
MVSLMFVLCNLAPIDAWHIACPGLVESSETII